MIFLDTVVSAQRFGKEAIDCNSICQAFYLSSQHMHMDNINLSIFNDVLSLREGPTLFQSQYTKFFLILKV